MYDLQQNIIKLTYLTNTWKPTLNAFTHKVLRLQFLVQFKHKWASCNELLYFSLSEIKSLNTNCRLPVYALPVNALQVGGTDQAIIYYKTYLTNKWKTHTERVRPQSAMSTTNSNTDGLLVMNFLERVHNIILSPLRHDRKPLIFQWAFTLRNAGIGFGDHIPSFD